MARQFFVMAFCFFAVTSNASMRLEFTGSEYAQIMLLLSQSDFDLRLAAKSIYRAQSTRQSILDLAGEVTWTACSGSRIMDTDTLSWLGKALGKTKQARYAGLLDFCLSRITDKKVVGYLTEAKNSLEGTTSASFEGGKMDLAQVRTRMKRNGTPAPSRDQIARGFENLRKSQSLDEVYEHLGVPNDVKGVNVVGDKKAGHLYYKFETSEYMVEFSYTGLGTARFSYDDEKTNWLLDEAKSDKGLIWARGGGRFVATANDLILQGDATELHDMARRLLDQSMVERTTLDRIADRLYRSREEKDDKLADSLAWLCKVVAKSRDGRYKPLLLDISNTAAHKTLRKYAAQAASELPETTGEKFVPSLVKERAAGL